jgi:hypothetical protein
MTDTDILGLRVLLDRTDLCHANVAIVRAGAGGTYVLECEECNSSRGPLPEAAADFLRSSVRVFGTPSAPIFITRAMAPRSANQMNRNDLFPSRYIKASDLAGKPLTLAIKSASVDALKNMKGDSEDKLVVSFVGQPKKFVVNRTNYDVIADLYGDETDQWPGKKIELFPSKANLGGRSVDCVRVRAPNGDAFDNDPEP